MEFDSAIMYFLHQRGISTQQQLLTSLTLGIEGTANLNATEGAVGEHATILTGKRNTLGYTLIDDVCTDLCQTIYVGLTGTVVSTFDGIVEETVDAVAIVLIVLCGINTTLGSNGVSAAR